MIIPLWWIVDYQGESFEVQSISPISINTLVYGSDTHGLTYTNIDLNAEDVASKIADKLNISRHIFKEKLKVNEERAEHNILLPYSVQIHRGKISDQVAYYYLVNPWDLLWWDSIVSNNPDSVWKSLVWKMRPEWIINNNNNEIDENYSKQTWKTPTRCWSWGHFIQEYVYYFYEKRNLDK